MKDLGIDDRLRVFHICATVKGRVVVVEFEYEGGVWIGGTIFGEGVEGVDERGVGGDRVGARSAPHVALGKSFQIEAGDDAKIVAATAEGEEQIRVECSVYVCY